MANEVLPVEPHFSSNRSQLFTTASLARTRFIFRARRRMLAPNASNSSQGDTETLPLRPIAQLPEVDEPDTDAPCGNDAPDASPVGVVVKVGVGTRDTVISIGCVSTVALKFGNGKVATASSNSIV